MKRADEDDSADRLREVEREILTYLMRHPDAKDTLEGITQWWLTADRVALPDVNSALEGLVEKGWLTVWNVGARRRVYGLERERRGEIETWLGK